MRKKVLIITVLWLSFAGILGFLYYCCLSGDKGPKIFLIFAEFLLTFLLAYWFLKNDIQEVTDSSNLSLIYSSTSSRNPDSLINSILIVTMTILSFVSLAPIVYCAYFINNGSLKIELVLKTAISIVLAYGCVMSFGKITLGYAIDILREVSTELAKCLQKINIPKEYGK